LGDERRQAKLKAMWDAVIALAPFEVGERRPLPAWSEPIAAALRSIYAGSRLDRHAPDDHELLQALEALGDALREQARLPQAADSPKLTVAEAIDLTLSRLDDARLAEESSEPAIELAGYLDLPLDDAPL